MGGNIQIGTHGDDYPVYPDDPLYRLQNLQAVAPTHNIQVINLNEENDAQRRGILQRVLSGLVHHNMEDNTITFGPALARLHTEINDAP